MGTTRDMVFNVRQLLIFITSVMTIEPGDLILTGTPAGVGPLRSDDQVSITIEGLGELVNPVEADTGI
jgi:2-keto-4-pentenoate hydratase/2-oxohepta-3-ene-1,7-dioic acid hydratase in catechol pathway